MKIQSLTVEQVFETMKTSRQGLSEVEAKKRLGQYGFNEIKKIKKNGLVKRISRQFFHFFALILWLAAFLCFWGHSLNPKSDLLPIGISIILVIMINGLFSFTQEYKTEKVIEEMEKLLPEKVRVIRDNCVTFRNYQEIVPGDLILIEEGDKIPADARIIYGQDLLVNVSNLNGESLPVSLKAESSDSDDLFSAGNIIFSGTYLLKGKGLAVVYSTGTKSEYGKIALLTQTVNSGEKNIEQEIASISRLIAGISILIGCSFFLFGLFRGLSFTNLLVFTLGIIVANVPEGLMPTVTFSLAIGSRRMAKKNFLVRNLGVIENLGAITVIASDKTGTITENRMKVISLFSDWQIFSEEQKNNNFLNSLLIFSLGENSLDPTEIAINDYLKRTVKRQSEQFEKVKEFSFDYFLKRSTVVNQISDYQLIVTKGAFESILPICPTIYLSGKKTDLTGEKIKLLREKHDQLAREGYRLIAISFRETKIIGEARSEVEQQMTFAGFVVLTDPPRQGVKEAVEKCREAGIRIVMITGDNPLTAAAIAQKTKIISEDSAVLTGLMLEKMTDFQIREKLKKNLVIARANPEHKLKVVNLLKEMKEIVAVTGDGVNDAPALKRADVGIAMGSGTDVAKEVAEAIILDNNFMTIVNGIEEGRACFANIRKFITYILTSNIPELIPYLAYFLFGIPPALTVPQILAIDLGTDLLPALALGAEKPEKGIMTCPPRKPEEKILSKSVFFRAYLFLGMLEAILALSLFLFAFKVEQINLASATTLTLCSVIFCQIGNGFGLKNERESVLNKDFFSNKFYLWGIFYELTLLILLISVPFLQRIFGTAFFALNYLLYILPMPLIILLAEELRKRIFYGRRKKG